LPKAEVEKVCPWYFQIKCIVGERPNVKPVGIGNSASELDLDVLAPATQDDTSGPEDIEPIAPSENDDDDTEEIHREDRRRTQNKRSASIAGLNEDIKPKLETAAHPNVLKPTAVGSKSKKSKGLEELVEIATVEEATCQKELDLEIQKSKAKASKVQAKAEVQMAAIEAKKEKEKRAHEVEMMKFQLKLVRIRQVAPGTRTGVPTQLSQGNVHPSSLYPSFTPGFSFSDGGQFDGTSGNEGVGEGSFE
jgi:hypothetical protein